MLATPSASRMACRRRSRSSCTSTIEQFEPVLADGEQAPRELLRRGTELTEADCSFVHTTNRANNGAR